MKFKTIRKAEEETELNIVGATLLSIEEANALPDDLRSYDDWWWLRSRGPQPGYAMIVDVFGSVDEDGCEVDNTDNILVRPALQIANLSSTDLKIGDSIVFDKKEFEIISDSLAFCKTDIGACHFRDIGYRDDRNAEYLNDYEKSYAKEFVDRWFERTMKGSK